MERIRAVVADRFADDAGGHDLAHLDRVARLGRELAKEEGADPEVVVLAAYCHDVHRLVERESGHAEPVASGACEELVRAALAEAEVVAELVAPVLECVAFCDRHGFAGDDADGSIEAKVLRDADNLDAIGAVGIARAFAFGALLGEPLWRPDAQLLERYRPGRTSSVVGHFEEKLVFLAGDMLTRSGEAVARERHAVLEAFLDRFKTEWAADDVRHALPRPARLAW